MRNVSECHGLSPVGSEGDDASVCVRGRENRSQRACPCFECDPLLAIVSVAVLDPVALAPPST
jgi:hypothetical protein